MRKLIVAVGLFVFGGLGTYVLASPKKGDKVAVPTHIKRSDAVEILALHNEMNATRAAFQAEATRLAGEANAKSQQRLAALAVEIGVDLDALGKTLNFNLDKCPRGTEFCEIEPIVEPIKPPTPPVATASAEPKKVETPPTATKGTEKK